MSDFLPHEVYRDDHLLITQHSGTKVAVRTGLEPESMTPTIVDAVELNESLRGFLNSEVSDE